MKKIRHLCLILGDQLNRDSLIFADFDPAQDLLWMAEILGESTHVPSSKQRSTLFLAAMRHFAQELQDEKLPLIYYSLEEHGHPDFASAINATLRDYAVTQLCVV